MEPTKNTKTERMYDGDPYQMAAELNVTVQIIEDYRALLYEHVR